jgi:hypothetical protein
LLSLPSLHVSVLLGAEQVPIRPDTRHERQPSLHAVLQQMPPTQFPVTHSAPLPQDSPFGRLQSGSWPAGHPDGHWSSSGPQARGISIQRKVQLAGSPLRTRIVSRLLVHASRRELHWDTGSQDSPLSTTLLPQRGWQSPSLVLLHDAGQQPSPLIQVVCCRSFVHAAVQLPGFTSWRNWQPCGGQAVGQVDSGSQVS